MRSVRWSFVVIAVLGLSLAFAQAAAARPADTYGKLPLYFERNMGQTDSRVEFLSRGPGFTLFLSRDEAVMALRRTASPGADGSMDVLRMKFIGSRSSASLVGVDPLDGVSNYFTSAALEDAVTNVPHFARVRYSGIYEGIDLVFYGDQRQLEYDFVVRPGGDPREIRLAFEGATRLGLDSGGNLVVGTSGGQVVQQAPRLFQEANGERHEVEGRYVLRAKGRVGFQVGQYDRTRALVIDPVVVYSTYMGGYGDNQPSAFAVDEMGNAYIAGVYYGPLVYPVTPGSVGTVCRPGWPGSNFCWTSFVTKIRPDGSLEYSTYLGGYRVEITAIQADGAGNAYILGWDHFRQIPTTSGCLPATGDPCGDIFLVKLNPTGSSLLHANYLFDEPFTNATRAGAMVLDSSGAVYLAGQSSSPTFPATPGAYQTSLRGWSDLFVAKIDPALDHLIYATLLGGTGQEHITGRSWGLGGYSGLGVDAAGNAYVAGQTTSWDFPVVNALFSSCSADDPTATECRNSYVAKLDPTGSHLIYSTYLDSMSREYVAAPVDISVQDDGHVVLAIQGRLAWEPTPGGIGVADGQYSVVRLDPAGSPVFHMRLPRSLAPSGVDATATGDVYLTGLTYVTYDPQCGVAYPCWSATPDALQPSKGNVNDAFVARISPLADELRYFSYWGGSGFDYGGWIRTDSSGGVYVAGRTMSEVCPFTPETNDFPIKNAVQAAFAAAPCGFPGEPEATGTPWQVDCSEGWATIDGWPVDCYGYSGFLMKMVPGDNTPSGADIAVAPIDGIDLTFGSITTPGTTSVARTNSAPAIPAGFTLGDPAKYYEISTSAEYTGPVQVCIDYSGVNYVVESGLRLLHYEEGVWQDRTTSLDTAGNIICGSVGSLSPFAVVRPPMPPLQPDGFQSPLAALVPEGSTVPYPDKAFKLGRTLPLKFILGSNGTPLTDADVSNAPKLAALAKVGQAPLNLDTLDLDAGQANDGSRLFRYAEGAWTYNLSTKGLTAGSYTITVWLPDGARFVGGIVLK